MDQHNRQEWSDAARGPSGWIRLSLLYVRAAMALLVVRLCSGTGAAPAGRELTAREAPRLFRTLARLQARLDGPRIARVLVDDAFHAIIRPRPRRLWFWGHRHELVLGLPYLLAATPRELLSTVARDYAHLCGQQRHHAQGGWRASVARAVYRQRRRLVWLHQQLADSHGKALPASVQRRLDAFMPPYLAATLALSRACEYAADRTAGAVFGVAANTDALVRLTLLGRWIDTQFWPTLFSQATARPRPAFMPFSAMRTAFKASHASWARPELLAAVWRQSDDDSAAPALRDRIIASGQAPLLPAPVLSSAADALLGRDTTRRLIVEFDHSWWTAERKAWRARYGVLRRAGPDDWPAPDGATQPMA